MNDVATAPAQKRATPAAPAPRPSNPPPPAAAPDDERSLADLHLLRGLLPYLKPHWPLLAV